MKNPNVVLKICKEYNAKTISSALEDAFNLLGGLSKFIKPKAKVLIKPDLYYGTEPNLANTTHPAIIEAVAELLNSQGANCIIADSPKGDFNQYVLDKIYTKTQMLNASNSGYATLNTNYDICVFQNPLGVSAKKFYLIDAINDADVIINIGKFRCDNNLGLIGCGQNLFGLVAGKIKNLIKARCYTSKKFFNYNIDIFETLENKIVLNILDGIVSHETNKDQRILNTILIGENPYSIDCTALKIINENPEENIFIQEAVTRQKMEYNYQILGDNIEQLIKVDYNYSNPTSYIFNKSLNSLQRQYNSTQKRAIIPYKNCKGCKTCLTACPTHAISIKSSPYGEYAVIDYDKCINCFECVKKCPYKIIETKTPLKYKIIAKNIDKKTK